MLSSWVSGGNTTQLPKTSDDSKRQTLNNIQQKINPQHIAYRNIKDPVSQYMWLFSGKK